MLLFEFVGGWAGLVGCLELEWAASWKVVTRKEEEELDTEINLTR